MEQATLPSIRQLLTESWRLYISRFWTLALISVPSIIEFFVTHFYLAKNENWTGILISIPLLFFVAIFVQASIVGNIVSETNLTARESWQYSIKNFWKFMWVTILGMLVVFGGFFLLVVPGIIWLVAIALGVPILAVEGIGGWQALLKSRSYVSGRWWRVFGYFIALAFVLVVPIMFLSLVLLDFSEIAAILIAPFTWVYTLKLYQHLKTSRPNPEVKDSNLIKFAAVLGVLIPLLALFSGFALRSYLPELDKRLEVLESVSYEIDPLSYSNILSGGTIAEYIITELNRGVYPYRVRDALLEVGWPEKDVDQVFDLVSPKPLP